MAIDIDQCVGKCIKSIKLDKIRETNEKKKDIKSFRIRELKINAFLVISELMASFGKVLRSFGDIGEKFTNGPSHQSSQQVLKTFSLILYILWRSLQGPQTHIDAFQTNIFS